MYLNSTETRWQVKRSPLKALRGFFLEIPNNHDPFQIAGDISTGNASAINFDSYLSVARLHLRGQKRQFLFCWIT